MIECDVLEEEMGAVHVTGNPRRAAVSTSLPVVDWKGDTQLIEAKGMDFIHCYPFLES
jgi:hypothetical protein